MIVTLYHKGEYGYEKTICENVKLHVSSGVSVNDNGYTQANTCVLRIFTSEPICLAAEDKMEIGKSDADFPSLDAFTVIRITDNRVGMHKHWKVECI